ncbi:MAG TPA: response regulator [Myxococcota bacterium]|jgi:DNA-binding response OmpR family regulator
MGLNVETSTFAAWQPLALLAEDDPDIQHALQQFIAYLGFDVSAHSNGSDALDALAHSTDDNRRDIDIVVLDIRMPGINGLSIAEALRADGWQVPIVIISAYDDELLLTRIRDIRRCFFFAKPIDPVSFAAALRSLRSHRWPGESRRFLR